MGGYRRESTRGVHGRFVSCIWAVSLLPGVASIAYSKDSTEPAKAMVKVADDFAKMNIETIRMPERPTGENQEYERRMFDCICEEIKKAGYTVVVEPAQEPQKSEAKASLFTRCTRGKTVKEALEKDSYGSKDMTDGEKYSLSVSLKITANMDGKTQEAYSATCKMWHKYSIAKKIKPGNVQIEPGAIHMSEFHHPIDYSGKGPNTLEKAIPEMGTMLTKDLPRRK